MDTDEDIHDRLERLEARVAEQQQTIEQLSEGGAVGRRSVVASLLGAGAVGGLAGYGSQSARAQASGPAGQVGTAEEPVDGFLWDLDVQGQVTSDLPMGGNDVTGVGALETEDLNADNVVLSQDTFGSISEHTGQSLASDGTTYTIFDVAETVDVIGGYAAGYSVGELTITWGDDTTDEYSASFTFSDQSGDESQFISIPSIKDASKLELGTVDQSGGNNLAYEVLTI